MDVFDEPTDRRIAHIDLAQSADLALVAPASADMIARMAHGLADDMLAACLLATPQSTPLLVAPAMNTHMWQHPATLSNVALIASRGAQIIAPGVGLLACKDVGTGKLADVEDIVQAVMARLAPDVSDTNVQDEEDTARDWTGKHVLITAGATREPLDPVRFLSNRSSGKMGYALAEVAARRGADVTVVSGFATAPLPREADVSFVGTAQEMLAACRRSFSPVRRVYRVCRSR